MAALQFATSSLDRHSVPGGERINEHDLHLETPLQKKLQHDKKVHKNNKNVPVSTITNLDGVESESESMHGNDEEAEAKDDESNEPANTDEITSLSEPRNSSAIHEEIWNSNDLELEDIQEETQDGSQAGAEDEAGDEDELALNVDDDDYGDLEMDDDNVSVSTDDSKKFEAEVEHELEQLGVEGIDWDDENTYAYGRMPGGSYAIDVDLTTPDSVFELEIFRPDEEAELFAAEQTGTAPSTDIALSQIVFSTEWPVPSDSEAEDEQAEPVQDELERRISAISQTSDLTSLMTDTGYETDEEEFPEQLSISSPGLRLTRTPQRPGSSADNMDRRITAFTPRRRGLQPTIMKNLPIRQKKAVAYTVRESYGNVVHFKTPKNSKLRWISIRTRRESSESDNSPASPTMVDLDNALMEGNTRTGAHISDAINGRLFQQYHCTQVQLPEPVDFGDSNLTEFARNPVLMGSIRGIFENALVGLMEQAGDMDGDDDDEFRTFFDIEGGYAEDDSTSTSNPTPVSRTASFAGFVEEEEDDSQTVRGDADDEEEPESAIKPNFSSSLKRRASDNLKSVSPELKRKKLELPALQ